MPAEILNMEETPSSATVDESIEAKSGGGLRDHLPLSEDETILATGDKSLAGAVANGLSAAIYPGIVTVADIAYILTTTDSLDWTLAFVPIFLGAATLLTVLVVSYRARYLSYVVTDQALYTTNRITNGEAECTPYSEVEKITRSQTLPSRIFGGGTVTLVTTHDASDTEFAPPLGTRERRFFSLLDSTNINLTDVSNPDDLETYLREYVDGAKH